MGFFFTTSGGGPLVCCRLLVEFVVQFFLKFLWLSVEPLLFSFILNSLDQLLAIDSFVDLFIC